MTAETEERGQVRQVRGLAQAEKVRKGKGKGKYAREHQELRIVSKQIWLDANHLTEDNESNDSKQATSDQPRKRKTQSSWKPYTNMSAGRRRYAGYSLQAHKLLQKVACDVQIHRKEKNKGYNKLETIFHQWKRDGTKNTEGAKNDGEFFKHLEEEQSWDF